MHLHVYIYIDTYIHMYTSERKCVKNGFFLSLSAILCGILLTLDLVAVHCRQEETERDSTTILRKLV